MADDADFIVVGGGSAGCVIASRLSEDPGTRVLLLEAGGEGTGWRVEMPAGSMFMIGNPKTDWCFAAEPDASLGGRHLTWPAGKMLGGGSSINGQVYIRGTRADYDAWEAAGATGWGWDDVAPYFRKAERYEGPHPPPSAGTDGPLSVSPPRINHEMLEPFLDGMRELGYPTLTDYFAGDQTGAFRTLASHRAGERCSTAKAYLRPVLGKRPNLAVRTRTTARRVIVEGGRAVGVEIERDGTIETLRARREVIVSSGAIGSPALLQRSGIGPAQMLRALGIPVVLDRPAVGANLQEHPAALVKRLAGVPTWNSQMGLRHKVRFGLQYLFSRSGPLTALIGEGAAFVRTLPDLAEPDIQLHFTAVIFRSAPDGTIIFESKPGVLIAVNVCRPYSRGSVTLRAADPHTPPIIRHEAFGDPRDLDTLVRGLKFADRIYDTAAMQPYLRGRYDPETDYESDDQWRDFARRTAQFAYHPVGTCRMGDPADGAVVDPELRLSGIAGLRVADASIMPRLVSANTNPASIMIGEKAADLIRHGSRDIGRHHVANELSTAAERRGAPAS